MPHLIAPNRHVWLLNEALEALRVDDVETLCSRVADNPNILDASDEIRRKWIRHVTALQGDVVAYERILRYYQEIGAPDHPAFAEGMRGQVMPSEEAASLARKELLKIGKEFVGAALRRWDPWKDKNSVRKALALLTCAHKELTKFYRSVRRQTKTYRRQWDRLTRDERIDVINLVPEMMQALKVSSELCALPEAQWRMAQYNPIFYFVDNPKEYMVRIHLKPSELAWVALAKVMGVGEATLKRWIRRGVGPRPRT